MNEDVQQQSGKNQNTLLNTLYDDLVRSAEMFPDRVACVGLRSEKGERLTLTYRHLKTAVDDLAAGLQQLGVRKGDIVSVQLPNVVEFAIITFAIFKLGAVLNGITSIYREREVEFILQRTESKVYVVPSSFRGFDHLSMAVDMKKRIPSLQHLVTIDEVRDFSTGILTLDSLRGTSDGTPTKSVELTNSGGLTNNGAPTVQADDLAQIAFTSGTTGEPKGVMHTHRTLRNTVTNYVKHVNPPNPFVDLVVSPVGHQTGFLWGTILSTYLGGTAIYLDIWNATNGWNAILTEGVSAVVAAAPFLHELVLTVEEHGAKKNSLEMICIPGAPIPRSLVPVATEKLQCRIVPAWGMTEYGIALAAGAGDLEHVYKTDGRTVPGACARVVDQDGHELPSDTEGDLQIKGEGLFIGYYKRPDLTDKNFTEGWFHTGDRAVISSEGDVQLTGRSKDIIIRGGENVPVQDIENILFKWYAIRDVAVVAMPDERLGERACAYVVPEPGFAPTLEMMKEYLSEQKVTKQFWPERVECVDELPRTASGKVQKYILRDNIRKRIEIEVK